MSKSTAGASSPGPDFIIGGQVYTLAEMLAANDADAATCEWLRAARPGDQLQQMHAEPVACIEGLQLEQVAKPQGRLGENDESFEPTPGLYVKPYGMGVRRVKSGFDLICEEFVDGRWIEFWRVNEMADDFAYTHADDACRAKVRQNEAKALAS